MTDEEQTQETLILLMDTIEAIDDAIEGNRRVEEQSFETLSREDWNVVQALAGLNRVTLEGFKRMLQTGSKAVGNKAFEAHASAVLNAED